MEILHVNVYKGSNRRLQILLKKRRGANRMFNNVHILTSHQGFTIYYMLLGRLTK